MIDRREEWMGLGIILAELRLNVWLENREDSKLGMRLKTRIGWRSLFTSGTFIQQNCVERFLSPFDMELKEHYNSNDEIFKWLVLLDKLESMYNVRSALTDQAGWHMMTWVFDNPLPKEWDEFLLWVESYDAERDMLSHENEASPYLSKE